MKLITAILLLASCTPRTGMYVIKEVKKYYRHETVKVAGYKKPIEFSTCDCHNVGDSIYLNFKPKYFLNK